MKKLLSVILAIAMLFSLAACGTSDEASAPAPAPTSASETAATSTDAPVAADAADTPVATDAVEVDSLTIQFSTTYQESETAGQIISHFIEYLQDISGGKIAVNMAWGGTLFDGASQLSAVSEGAVDMIAYQTSGHYDETPLMSIPSYAPNSNEFVIDYYNYLLFENEQTSSLFSAEASAMGIKYLNVLAGGPDAFCATFAFDTLDELVTGSSAFGIMDAGAYTALGLHCTSVAIPDRYDSLDRGIIDTTTMALSAISSMGWYEVAPHVVLNGLYSAGNFFTVNEAWWNRLSAAQQDLIQRAADEATAYSVELINQGIDSATANIESNGGTVKTLSDEDVARWWGIFFDTKYTEAMDRAANLGVEKNMDTVFQAAADFTGYTISK